MTAISLPDFTADRDAAEVDASLHQALNACDRARECAVLWFAEVQRRALFRALGYASLELYATQGLGFSLNRYWQFKRLADDLDRLPLLRDAVASGDVGWTKAQQVARVAAPLAPAQATFTLRTDAVQLARLEALMEKARKLKRVPAGADRTDLVLAALEALVAGESGGGGPSAQIIVHQCPDCAAATVVTSRGEPPLAPAQVAALACDAHVKKPGKPNRATIAPSVRAAVLARDRHRCTTPGCRSAHFLEVHHVVPRSQGGSNRAENLTTLCSRCHGHVHERYRTSASLSVCTSPATDARQK